MLLGTRRFYYLLAGLLALALSLAGLALWGAQAPIPGLAAKKPTKVTIWIHGTNLQLVLPKRLHGLLPLTYQPQRTPDFTTALVPIQELGLQSQLRAAAIMLCQQDPAHFDLAQFYLWRWSGSLGTMAREHAAVDLYASLTALVADLTARDGVAPEITLIGYSHGGNVALSLARVYDRAQLNFQIQRLILLACPVLPESCQAARDPLFGQIYALYSHGDWVQVSDWQGGLAGFSVRSFPVAPNLQQASVRQQGQDLDHFGFKRPDFIANLPAMLQLMTRYRGRYFSVHRLAAGYQLAIASQLC